MIDPRKVATLGIGFGALAIASLGFQADTQVVPEPIPIVRVQTLPGGGSYYDTGKGYIKKDHGWVKATKFSVTGAKAHKIVSGSTSAARVPIATTSAKALVLETSCISKSYGSIAAASCGAYSYDYDVSSTAEVGLSSASAHAESGHLEYLSADELLIILETMTC